MPVTPTISAASETSCGDTCTGFVGEGRNDLVQGWLDRIDAERAAGCHELALAAAHSGLALGSVTLAEQWARSAAVGLSETAEEPTTSCLPACCSIEAWAARSGARHMGEVAARASDLLADDDPWRASCCLLQRQLRAADR